MELSKYIVSEAVEIERSKLHFAPYNPREIDPDAYKTIKRGIKRFGMVGGLVINKRTDYTIVGGHQRIAVMDDLEKFNTDTHDNDYKLRVDIIDVDLKTEKALNILLNNPNASGRWNYDKLAELIPDIDYKDAGLTEADLNMIGVDFMLQTEQENSLSNALTDMMQPATDQHNADVAQRKAAREAESAEQRPGEIAAPNPGEDFGAEDDIPTAPRELTREEKIQQMKDLKAQVRQKAEENAANMDAYVVLSFDNWQNKVAFCQRFDFDPYKKFFKGEAFDLMVERVEE